MPAAASRMTHGPLRECVPGHGKPLDLGDPPRRKAAGLALFGPHAISDSSAECATKALPPSAFNLWIKQAFRRKSGRSGSKRLPRRGKPLGLCLADVRRRKPDPFDDLCERIIST